MDQFEVGSKVGFRNEENLPPARQHEGTVTMLSETSNGKPAAYVQWEDGEESKHPVSELLSRE